MTITLAKEELYIADEELGRRLVAGSIASYTACHTNNQLS